MSPNTPQDELLKRYEQAKAVLPDGLPDAPPATLHEIIIQAARQHSAQAVVINADATNTIAPRADSMPATEQKNLENSEENKIQSTVAANDSIWNITFFASIAVMGLSGLLWWQFERGAPQEPEAATSAKPSPAVVATAPAPAPTIAPAPTNNPTPAAAATARQGIQTNQASAAKIAAAEMTASNAPTWPAPAPAGTSIGSASPETVRSPTPDAAPTITAAPAAAPEFSQADKAIAIDISSRKSTQVMPMPAPAIQSHLESAQAPPMAAAAPPPPAMALESATRAAMPATQASVRPSQARPGAVPPSAFSRQTLLAAIDSKDALTLRQSLAQGISPNIITTDGNPALTQAVTQRWAEGMRILLSAGADRSATNSKGHTASDVALELGYTELAELLMTTR